MSRKQRFEYTTLKVSWNDFEEEAEEKINALAQDGWQLIETAGLSGNTTYYLFERPVEE